jgi:hypothetical protein
MAVNAAPASRSHRLPLEARWYRFAFRVILALLALWALHFAVDRSWVFQRDFSANSRMNTGLWLAWVGSAAAAGFVFGVATWLPFGKVRYLWSRLVLAAVPLIPLAEVWVGLRLPVLRAEPPTDGVVRPSRVVHRLDKPNGGCDPRRRRYRVWLQDRAVSEGRGVVASGDISEPSRSALCPRRAPLCSACGWDGRNVGWGARRARAPVRCCHRRLAKVSGAYGVPPTPPPRSGRSWLRG